jgi:methylmalonyl-CoA/ethylmalonyl-CoA epimerase
MIKKIDHIAIAVKNLDEEIKRYRDVLGLEFHGAEVVEEQKVRVAFFKVGDVHIELTEPTEADSPVGKFIAKRGCGIHHIAFEVEDIEARIEDLAAKNVEMIDKEPKIGAENAKIAFAHPKSFSGVLYELKEIAKDPQPGS